LQTAPRSDRRAWAWARAGPAAAGPCPCSTLSRILSCSRLSSDRFGAGFRTPRIWSRPSRGRSRLSLTERHSQTAMAWVQEVPAATGPTHWRTCTQDWCCMGDRWGSARPGGGTAGTGCAHRTCARFVPQFFGRNRPDIDKSKAKVGRANK
jgi:hypothetical protein